MTRTPYDPPGPHENRTRIVLAVLTGLIAGATRAITDYLLGHLSS